MLRRQALCDKSLYTLINEVKKRECLWNPDHDRYNDRYKMAKGWMEIAEIVELPEERLRAKWKNLRDVLKKEIKKFGSPENYTGKWRHFEIMKFLIKPSMENADTSAKENDEVSTIEAKEELEDDEYEFEVEEDQEAEGVYLNDTYEEDPIPDKRAKLCSEEEYDVMFLKSLAPYFRQLDPIRKLVVRSKMQDMLLNEIAAQTSATQLNSKKS